jgi:hypothetical protein
VTRSIAGSERIGKHFVGRFFRFGVH